MKTDCSTHARAWLTTLLLSCAAGPLAGQGASLPLAIELRVPRPPTIASGEGDTFLVHELHVTNFSPQPMTLRRVEVVSGTGSQRRVLLMLADSALLRALARPGQNLPAQERTRLQGGTRAVVFVWAPLGAGAVPASIQHRVHVQQGASDSAVVQELDGAEIVVEPVSAPVGPPLRGGVWLTANGPAPDVGHRRALIVVGATPRIAQRFAIDYVVLGDDGRTHTGDALRNDSYHAYGRDAIAVAEGTVVGVKDGIPENVPGPTSRAVPITLETVGGNYVIVDIGGGRYAFYAHLQPGSLRVREGERVQRGQVLGLVGNSGNSTEPHLHFHIADAPSPLGSEGVPYRLDSFELIGRCASFTSGCERSVAQTRRDELPLGSRLVRFPE